MSSTPDEYYNRQSKQDSLVIASWCFMGILAMGWIGLWANVWMAIFTLIARAVGWE